MYYLGLLQLQSYFMTINYVYFLRILQLWPRSTALLSNCLVAGKSTSLFWQLKWALDVKMKPIPITTRLDNQAAVPT